MQESKYLKERSSRIAKNINIKLEEGTEFIVEVSYLIASELW